jgi:hypothetical protein
MRSSNSIRMNISNNNYQTQLRAYYNSSPKVSLNTPTPTYKALGGIGGLKNPIVGRIFQVKPGCGSCGK